EFNVRADLPGVLHVEDPPDAVDEVAFKDGVLDGKLTRGAATLGDTIDGPGLADDVTVRDLGRAEGGDANVAVGNVDSGADDLRLEVFVANDGPRASRAKVISDRVGVLGDIVVIGPEVAPSETTLATSASGLQEAAADS